MKNKIDKEDKEAIYKEQKKRLEELAVEQKRKRVLGYPTMMGILALLVLILYVLFQNHCMIDIPLLIFLVIVSVFMVVLILYKNRKLCERIEDMMEERRKAA